MVEGGVRFGRYELLRQIARGGMAQIFLAVEHGLEGAARQVVVKRVLPEMTISEDFVAMFADEARLVMRIAHPNVAHVYDFGEVDGVYYLAMEHVDGVTASRLIRKLAPRRIPVRVALRIAADMCAGLHFAHELRGADGRPLGVIHRDVSPQNVIVSRTGVSKLIDFGVARASTQVHVTRAQQLKGKLPYMAPELFHGELPDRRVDVFATGVVLCEMLTGRRLYKRENEASIVSAILYEKPPSELPLDVPSAVGPIVARALAKDREERYPTAEKMQHDLEAVIAENRLVATHYVVGQFITKWLKDNPLPEGVPASSVVSGPTTGSFSSRSGLSASMQEPPRKDSEAPTAADMLLARREGVLVVEESPRPAPPSESSVTFPSTVTPAPGSNLPAPRASRRAILVGVLGALVGLSALAVAIFLGIGGRGEGDGDEGRQLSGVGPGQPSGIADAAPLVPPERGVEDAGAASPMEAGPALAEPPAEAGPPDGGAAAEPADAAAEGPRRGGSTRPARAPGTLFLDTDPWSRVYLRGRSLGVTPIVGAKVPAGSHRLRLVDADGKTHSLRVVIRPGEPTKVFRRLAGR